MAKILKLESSEYKTRHIVRCQCHACLCHRLLTNDDMWILEVKQYRQNRIWSAFAIVITCTKCMSVFTIDPVKGITDKQENKYYEGSPKDDRSRNIQSETSDTGHTGTAIAV